MKNLITFLLLSLSIFSVNISTATAATTRYVTDELEINLRAGQGVKYRTKKMVSSGTKLSILETDPNGYSKVRTSSGVEGWVLTRFLSNMPSTRNRLASSEQKVANLELKLANSKEEMTSLSSQNSSSTSENSGLKETAQRLTKELNELKRTASNAVALSNDNRRLKEQLQQIDNQIQSLIIENSSLKDSEAKRWFLIGAAVLFAGIFLGLILPRLRIQKKNSWGSF
ncbi:MAG: ligand-binding protein SH3 [Gammaproteobacteria bacterium]|nr:MAG: ligand-binding protein SH3 [Gammaproteobacteria bacterium]